MSMDELLLERIPALTRPIPALQSDGELQSILNGISPGHALVLRLHFLDEMPLKRIAAFLGVPLTTVKWRIHRGKEWMREILEREQGKGRQWKKNKS